MRPLLFLCAFTKPILFNNDFAHDLVRVTCPPFSAKRFLSILKIIPRAPAIVMAVLTTPPHSLSFIKYCCTMASIRSPSERGLA